MAGMQTRMRYDTEAYDEFLQRSVGPMEHELDITYNVNDHRCFAPYRPMGYDGADAYGEQADVESILRGITKINSKSNRQQVPDSLSPYHTSMTRDCSPMLETEYTRFTTPSYEIRGMNTTDIRLEYPLHDPQCQIFENFEENTRLAAKDNFRGIWQIPFGQKDLWPTERLGQVKDCSIDLNCAYASVNF